jgi:chromosome segregation ATPase
MSTLQNKLPALLTELELIHSKGWDPKFCSAKLRAVVEDDVEGYCEALEEELAVKNERLVDLERAGDLSTEIVERLRSRIQDDEESIEHLRKENDAFAEEFKKINWTAQEDGMERLVTNLEAENRREAARTATAQKELRRLQAEHADLLKKHTAAQEQLSTLKTATWA